MKAALVLLVLAACETGVGAMAAADCALAPRPVLALDFGSRYADGDATRSEVDAGALDAAQDAIRPVDAFLRDLTDAANKVFDPQQDAAAIADCVLGQMAVWAQAGALADLASDTAQLTIGSRLAGFGLVALQVLPHARNDDDARAVTAWLTRAVQAQALWWEDAAPPGARQGNLRAWAALAAATTSALTGDPALRGWAAWSFGRILCSAAPDGSLPQEMRRGRLALQYQLHAIAPLAVGVLLLDRQGVSLTATCDDALARIVAFGVDDLDDGRATQAITGQVQSYFDGSDTVQDFELAFIEAYLLLDGVAGRDRLDQLVQDRRPLGYSKLGGNQTLIWRGMGF